MSEYVPGSAHGVDHRRPVRIDLLAQVGDVELDHVRLAAEVVVPDPIEDLGLAEHPPRVAHQVAQQLELGGRQRDLDPAPGDFVAVFVKREIADHQRGVARTWVAPLRRSSARSRAITSSRLNGLVT